MSQENIVVAVFERHAQAEDAVRSLGRAGFPLTQLTIVGKGYHTDEKVVGFYNIGDRIKLWGKNGAFWGGLWGLFVGGVLMTVPLVGPVVVLGHLGAMLVGAAEGALLGGGLSALAGAFVGIGIPKDTVLRYEEAVRADRFLVLAHGSPEETRRAQELLKAIGPAELNLHEHTCARKAGKAAQARHAEAAGAATDRTPAAPV